MIKRLTDARITLAAAGSRGKGRIAGLGSSAVTPKPVGIKDVAEAAGVSVAAVSLALRGKGRISPATRVRIEEAASRLGYRPNAVAQSLAGPRTHVLAISLPEIAEVPVVAGEVQHFLGILGGAAGAALEAGHLLTVAPGRADSPAWPRLTFDGAVVADPAVDDELLEHVRSLGRPLVTIGRDPGGGDGDLQVDNDVRAATHEVLDHLRDGGATRVALAVSAPLMSVELDTVDAYLEWCADRGCAARRVVAGSPQEECVGRAVRELLDGPDPPDAVYATIDLLAVAILVAARERGWAVPGRLQVASLSDSALARRHDLTAIDERPAELGARAVELLAAHLAGDEPADARRWVATDLVRRGTTLAGR